MLFLDEICQLTFRQPFTVKNFSSQQPEYKQGTMIAARNGTADLLKGLAVLFMIQVHIMEQFGTPDACNSAIGRISLFLGGPPCAPVFLAVMGYFLASSSRPFSYFLKRGIVLFAGGILLNIGRSVNLLTRIFSGSVSLDPYFYLFGADILTLAGLSLVVIGVMRLVFREMVIPYLIAAVIIVSIAPLLPEWSRNLPLSAYVVSFVWNAGEWSYFPLFPWFAYVLAGYSFRMVASRPGFGVRLHKLKFLPVMTVVGVLLMITLPWAAGIAHNLSGPGGYYRHGILFFGWVLLFMAGYLTLVNYLEKQQGGSGGVKMIRWIGENVTLIYVIQWLIIGNLATMFYQSLNVFEMLFWYVGITVVTALLGWGYLRIRKTFPGLRQQKTGRPG